MLSGGAPGRQGRAGPAPEVVCAIEAEALADTGAIAMAIPEDVAEQLGAPVVRRERVRVADGRAAR
jgi:predicted aspartyl protease